MSKVTLIGYSNQCISIVKNDGQVYSIYQWCWRTVRAISQVSRSITHHEIISGQLLYIIVCIIYRGIYYRPFENSCLLNHSVIVSIRKICTSKSCTLAIIGQRNMCTLFHLCKITNAKLYNIHISCIFLVFILSDSLTLSSVQGSVLNTSRFISGLYDKLVPFSEYCG